MKMTKLRSFLWGTLAMLTALMVVSCWPGDNPVTKSTSLEVDTSDLVLSLGGTATRAATTQSPDYHFTYVSANPSVLQ